MLCVSVFSSILSDTSYGICRLMTHQGGGVTTAMESQTGSQAGLLSGGLVGKALPFLFLLFQLLQTTAAYQSAAYFCLLLISKPGKQK